MTVHTGVDPRTLHGVEYRVVVTGSRTWTDAVSIEAQLFRVLVDIDVNSILRIVHGGAKGADTIAARWAADYEHLSGYGLVRAECWPADWTNYGRRAGMVRNAAMVNAGADRCLAFIRDRSRGATHCARLAKKAGIPTTVFLWESIEATS